MSLFYLICQKSSVWSKKNAGVTDRAQKDLLAKEEDEDVLAKSKLVSILWYLYFRF